MSNILGSPENLDEKTSDLIVKFLLQLRNGKLESSTSLALATLSLLEQILSDSSDITAFELCSRLRGVCANIARAAPLAFAAHNVVKRVLKAVRDEYRNQADQISEGSSLQRLVLGGARRDTLPPDAPPLAALREHVEELRNEIETAWGSIDALSTQHAGAQWLAACRGADVAATRWLRAAAKPAQSGRLLLVGAGKESESQAARLSAAGVQVTLVDDSAIMAMMPRVDKVVISACAVLAGGSVLAKSGTRILTTAAKFYTVPVFVLCPLHLISPRHCSDWKPPPVFTSPALASLPYESGIDAVSPEFDIIPADHVTLFMTNLGGSSPSYIYRYLTELYDPNDYLI